MNKPQRFREVPVYVEAMRITDESILAVLEWLHHPSHKLAIGVSGEKFLMVQRGGGEEHAGIGDWIVREHDCQQFIILSQDTFAALYIQDPEDVT